MTLTRLGSCLATSIPFCLSALLTGCTLETTAPASFVPGTAISGTAHGGQQAITGAKVYLLAVNPTGYGGPGIAASSSNASVSLLKAASTGNAADSIGSYVLTTSAGGFSLSGDYSCSSGFAQSTGSTVTLSGSEQVYLYILGGQATIDSTTANAASGLLVALGACNSPTAHVSANEVTAVASGYAFAGFATDATHIGSSGSTLAVTNLSNAFANIANLANTTTGAPTASSSTMTTPAANVSTIANIVAACVNGTGTAGNCSTLFANTKATDLATPTTPTDTASAIINLAHNPWPGATGMTALFGLIPGIGAPFSGSLSAQPNDFTLTLQFSGGGLANAYALAIDGAGNAWMANVGNNSVSKLSNTGTALSPSNGFTGGGVNGPAGIAIDSTGNVWTSNMSTGSVSKLSSAGIGISGSNGYTGGTCISAPVGIAIDASGNVWVPDSGNSASCVSKFSSTGNGFGYTGGGLSFPYGVAIDVSGNVWIGNGGNNAISEFSSLGAAKSGSNGYTGGGLGQPRYVAIDVSGNVWAGNVNTKSVSELSETGTAISGSSGYTGGGLSGRPFSIAIDSAGDVWTANGNNSSVAKLSSADTALSPSTGFTNNGIAVALDGSGDVWTSGYNNGLVTEIIGASAPVVTPIVANLLTPYGTQTVNLP